VPDVIKENLDGLFIGENPGLVTAETRHHFAHHSNRFWSTLHSAGFTKELLNPQEAKSCSITVLVSQILSIDHQNQNSIIPHQNLTIQEILRHVSNSSSTYKTHGLGTNCIF
jgi:G:T/U-mismatch repair DNA glycosylase